MSSSKMFNGVTQSVFDCIKARSAYEHGTVYEPAGESSGVATTNTLVGIVKLEYQFDSAKQQVTYTVQEKPGLAPESEIWAGISNTIRACGG